MFRSNDCGPITRIHLARTFFGRPLYTVQAYLIDGLLIVTGCPATASELVAWCREKDVRQALNTHHHEDHSGGNGSLQNALDLPIAAPSKAVPILADFSPKPISCAHCWNGRSTCESRVHPNSA